MPGRRVVWTEEKTPTGEPQWTTTYNGVRIELTCDPQQAWSYRARGAFDSSTHRYQIHASGRAVYRSLAHAQREVLNVVCRASRGQDGARYRKPGV